MELLKSIAGKVAMGVVALAVVAGAISWFQMDQGARDTILHGIGKSLSWLGIVLVLPWATFFLVGQVAKMESNGAGAGLVMFYTAVEATLLAWLFDWSIRGAGAWTFYVAAVLIAGAYNLLACDWIAEKVG